MEHKTVQVPNIGCDGCVRSIKSAVSEIEGVRQVSGDAPSKTITVEWDSPATWERIQVVMAEIDYAPAPN